MLNLRQLDFVAIADAGTMTGAAQKMYVSQSAVSLAVAQLERSLGTQLLIRQKARGLQLTPAGRRLLPEARAPLAHAEEVLAVGEEEGGGLRGAVTVGCFRTAAPFLLPELLETLAAEQPDVAVDFIEDLERARPSAARRRLQFDGESAYGTILGVYGLDAPPLRPCPA